MKLQPNQKTLIKGKPAVLPKSLFVDVRQLILATREQAAQTVNAALTTLYWQMGQRIRQDIYIGDPLKRDLYAETCRTERWSMRTLGKEKFHQAVRLARARLRGDEKK